MENIEIILYLFFGVFILLIYFKYFQNGKISTKHEDLIKPFKDIIQNLENDLKAAENSGCKFINVKSIWNIHFLEPAQMIMNNSLAV